MVALFGVRMTRRDVLSHSGVVVNVRVSSQVLAQPGIGEYGTVVKGNLAESHKGYCRQKGVPMSSKRQ